MKLEVVTVWDQKKYRPLKIGQTIWGNYDKKEKLNLGVSNWWNHIPKRVATLLRTCGYKRGGGGGGVQKIDNKYVRTKWIAP